MRGGAGPPGRSRASSRGSPTAGSLGPDRGHDGRGPGECASGMLDAQMERLRPEEQRLLEVASVAGTVFSGQRLRRGGGPGAGGR